MLIVDQLRKEDRHIQVLAVLLLIGLFALVGRLWYVQVMSRKEYQANLEKNSFRLVRVPAIRGKILDRNGRPIADNRPSYNVNLYLEEFSSEFRSQYRKFRAEYKKENPKRRLPTHEDHRVQESIRFNVVSNVTQQIATTIGQPLQLNEKSFHNHFTNSRALPLPVLVDLSTTNLARFLEKSAEIPAVALDPQPLRIYPHSTLASHLIGYIRPFSPKKDEDEDIRLQVYESTDYKGDIGIERSFDSVLRGKSGLKSILVNSMNYREAENMIVQPQAGSNVVLTIDLDIQKAAEKALATVSPVVRGSVVVMDVESGDILAMVSSPSFDPNVWIPRISQEDYSKLTDPKLTPMYNRATLGQYHPGSIFKIIVGLACLENGLDAQSSYKSAGYFRLGNSRAWKDTAGEGDFDFNRAFYKSSNPYFQEHGLAIGVDKILDMGRQFGLGQLTGLEGYPESRGYFPEAGTTKKRWGGPWMQGDTANLCIGQGEIDVTPLQMAVMVTAVANRGTVIKPRLIQQIEPQGEHTEADVYRPQSRQIRNEIKLKHSTWNVLHNAMLMDTEHPDGTGKRAAVKGLQIFGKTGTAQQLQHGEMEYTTWFASFCSYLNKPRYSVVVMVQGGGSGGDNCAPVSRQVYEALLKMEQRNAQLDLTRKD